MRTQEDTILNTIQDKCKFFFPFKDRGSLLILLWIMEFYLRQCLLTLGCLSLDQPFRPVDVMQGHKDRAPPRVKQCDPHTEQNFTSCKR